MKIAIAQINCTVGDLSGNAAKILDAAEELFADRGYYGVSIRQITSKAGVELALVNYHFGKKENLFHEVINRRAAEHCDGFWKALKAVKAEADGKPLRVEAVIRAFCAPIFDAFKEALPGASERSIYYAVYFLQAELVYSLAETGGIDRISKGLVNGSDFDALLEEVVPFFAAGFHALAARP